MSGTRVNGVTPGTWDGVDVTVYSYQAVKNLPTGDSGMICFANEKDDKLARQLAWLGINKDTYARSNKGTYAWKYDVDYVGYKYNGNAIMAAIALVQLKYLDRDNARRREIVEMYNKGFENNSKIQIIRAPHADECSFHIYELIVSDREGLLGQLAEMLSMVAYITVTIQSIACIYMLRELAPVLMKSANISLHFRYTCGSLMKKLIES